MRTHSVISVRAERFSLLAACLLFVVASRAAAQIPMIAPEDTQRSIEHWIAALKSPDAMQRKKAAIFLQLRGGSAQTAVPALSAALKDKDAEVRHYVAHALANIGPAAVKAAPALAAALRDEDRFVRARAAQALGAIGAKAAAHAEAVADCLQDDDEYVRVSAAAACWKLDAKRAKDCLPVLVEALSHDSSQSEAIWALGEIGSPAASAVDAMLSLLDDVSELKRQWIARSLGQIGPAAKPAVPRLLKLLEDLPADERGEVVAALAAIAPDDPKVIEVLSSALRDSGNAGYYAAEALAKSGEKAAPILIAALAAEDGQAHARAAQALCEAGPACANVAPAVVAALAKAQGQLRVELLSALGCIGPDDAEIARGALALLELPEYDSDTAALGVGHALGACGPRAVPVLIEALSSPHLRTRLSAAAALAGQQAHAAPAIEQLAGLLKDPDSRVRRQAALALAAIGPEGEGVMQALAEYVGETAKLPRLERDEAGIEELCEAVCVYGPQAAPLAPALGKLIEVDPFGHAQEVLPALACMGPAAKEALPSLRKLMEQPVLMRQGMFALLKIDPASAEEWLPSLTASPPLHSDELEAIAALGPAAKSAVGAVQQTLDETTEAWVRYDANYALWRLDPRGRGANSVERLKALLESTPDDRSRILRVLASMGPAAAAAANDVRGYLDDADDYVRREAAVTLWRLAPESADEALRVLVKELEGSGDSASLEKFHRLPALAMLAEMGADAEPALPQIEARTRDPLPEVRRAAERAVRTIRAAVAEKQDDPAKKESQE